MYDTRYALRQQLTLSSPRITPPAETSRNRFGCREWRLRRWYQLAGHGACVHTAQDASTIDMVEQGAGVGYGFATMSTDTGHNSISSDLTWSLNAPESKIDWGYRAMHNSIVLSKLIVMSYYGVASKYNYYSGCSTGGRQGLRDIQLYPEDFDGVLAGAPAW